MSRRTGRKVQGPLVRDTRGVWREQPTEAQRQRAREAARERRAADAAVEQVLLSAYAALLGGATNAEADKMLSAGLARILGR